MDIKEIKTHKQIVQIYRKALASYLSSNNRADDFLKIMSGCCNLDDFYGNRIPSDEVINDLKRVTAYLQDDHIFLKLYEYIDIESLDFYQGIKRCISSINKNVDSEVIFLMVCRLIVVYFKISDNTAKLHLIKHKGGLQLAFVPFSPTSINKHHCDLIILIVYKILNSFSNVRPSKLVLSYRASEYDLKIYKRYLGFNTELSNSNTYLYYKTKTTLRKLFKSSAYIDFRKYSGGILFLSPINNMFIEEFPYTTYVQRCRLILLTTIGIFEPTREQVSQALNMSVSSLQRRLRLEGTTFKDVLLELRKQLSHIYLIDQKISASYVGYLLGYKSSSQFFTSFKRWYNLTPKEYQKLHLS